MIARFVTFYGDRSAARTLIFDPSVRRHVCDDLSVTDVADLPIWPSLLRRIHTLPPFYPICLAHMFFAPLFSDFLRAAFQNAPHFGVCLFCVGNAVCGDLKRSASRLTRKSVLQLQHSTHPSVSSRSTPSFGHPQRGHFTLSQLICFSPFYEHMFVFYG